jgi:hypothetical protein
MAVGVQATGERRPTAFRTAAFTAYALTPDRPRELFVVHEGRKLAGALTLRGDETGAPVVTLRPWAGVTGRVLRPDGTPAAGARISLQVADAEPDEAIRQKLHQRRRPVQTDRDGRFRLEGLFPGYGVTVFAFEPGHRSGTSFQPRVHTPAAGELKDLGDARLPYPKTMGTTP